LALNKPNSVFMTVFATFICNEDNLNLFYSKASGIFWKFLAALAFGFIVFNQIYGRTKFM
jgi:hypothetical protein